MFRETNEGILGTTISSGGVGKPSLSPQSATRASRLPTLFSISLKKCSDDIFNSFGHADLEMPKSESHRRHLVESGYTKLRIKASHNQLKRDCINYTLWSYKNSVFYMFRIIFIALWKKCMRHTQGSKLPITSVTMNFGPLRSVLNTTHLKNL